MRSLKRLALLFAALMMAQGALMAQLQTSEAVLFSAATTAADS